jgi:prepilin-type N-terminal cleavage/methylation domain-containing protein
MLARIRKSIEEKDQGFTLIELLVVMIIIGILAAIAIPVFLNQRKKAVDTAAKSDVSTIGKEVATYFVDNTAAATVGVDGSGHYTVNGNDIGRQSNKMGTPTINAGNTDSTWCVTLPYTGGTTDPGNVYYSAANGLSLTGC